SREERWARGLHAICGYPFVGEISSAVRYSDIGLMLLGEATTRLWSHRQTVLKLDQIINIVVCEPLELGSPIFNPVRSGLNRLTIPPTEDDPTWRKRRVGGEAHDETACGVGGVAGHAGLFANAGDVAALGQAWLERDKRLKISTELMDEATRQHAETNGE